MLKSILLMLKKDMQLKSLNKMKKYLTSKVSIMMYFVLCESHSSKDLL